jgi:hypothetical protein
MIARSAPLRVLAGIAALVAVWVAGHYVAGLDIGLIYLAPAFALLLPLLAGRYPGERLITPAQHQPRPARPRPLAAARRPPRAAPSGGLLVALALAGRAPPA